MKMCKSYMVLNLAKTVLGNKEGNQGLVAGTGYNMHWFPTLAQAQTKADELARGGTVSVIFESIEFRQIKPVPVEVSRVACCD